MVREEPQIAFDNGAMRLAYEFLGTRIRRQTLQVGNFFKSCIPLLQTTYDTAGHKKKRLGLLLHMGMRILEPFRMESIHGTGHPYLSVRLVGTVNPVDQKAENQIGMD